MSKEDRSGWVAVAPEFSNTQDDLPTVTPAQSAYQLFSRENSKAIKDSLIARGESGDLASLSKGISQRWHGLAPNERYSYESKAGQDKLRFMKESHLRDRAVMERKERLRKEREEIIVYEGNGRSTRGSRKREMKKTEREEKKRRKTKKKAKKSKTRNVENTDEGIFASDESSAAESSDYDSGDSDSSSQYSDSDESMHRGKTKKKRAAPIVSAAVLERREKAKQERDKKESYIAERQEDLRTERAAQAKKRLDFLLKQSDIFRYFGEVKEDKEKFYGNRGNAKNRDSASGPISDSSPEKSQGETATHRRESTFNEDNREELEQSEETDATFLTSQPSTLGFGKMRPYQLEGLNWMIRLQENGVNGILADEMGLGKTLQSVSILVFMQEYRLSNGPHLIVVPKSTLSNWMNEFKRWAPTLNVVKFHGTKEEREELARDVLQPGQIDEERSWNVCVTTYEICNLEKNVFNKFAWSYLIIDEAHRLKNEASAFSRTIRTYETRYRLLLTGTPLQNNLHELWALLNFLVPDVFASAEQFDEWFNLDIDDAAEKNKLISQLHKILRPFMIRRLKVDVEKSLPPKHETILFTGMSAVQKKLYKEILMRDVEMLKGGSGNHTAVLNIVMQLRKCAGHPYLFPGVEDRTLPPLGEHLVGNCGKMVLLDKLLKRLRELGHRVLLFTQMTRLLDIFEDYMVMRQYPYCRIDGNTDYEQRESSIEAFNAPDSEKFIFLLSTRAGGLGINLQTADVVILYDSDWNPQADLQAQDRAHRIGQKKPVQVFRLVTEHSIEEKVVERAQQKLKLDAMVVQQGRLKEKDKLSRQELIAAVRFGADKVFKSKDSSITDDDIELILEAGKKKTQELNDKLVTAEKGDMLDFKLDGGGSMQTFEGVDYSKQDFAQAKAAQEQAELLGILDMGKRERRAVANYNEDQLYRQQIASIQVTKKVEKKKKEIKLPRHLRLPRLDEWQMFDREALNAIQEEEEKNFRNLSEEMQMIVKGKAPTATSVKSAEGTEEKLINEDQKADEARDKEKEAKIPLTIDDIPPLIDKEKQVEKNRLLAEGFADWGRSHYSAFVKASLKYGRNMYSKIAAEVGKPQSMIEDYAIAFWDENVGKKRFTDAEYDRTVKKIEGGEKKIHLIKVLEKATRTFLSLFDNPWRELEFTTVNVKDKMFSLKEDRHLLCWAHKYGYGQWEAVKMAIRRSPDFRFDYYLRSLPTDLIGKRCEQLMKAAEKEVEQLMKKMQDVGYSLKEEGEEKKETNENQDNAESINSGSNSETKLPKFKVLKAMERKHEEEETEAERKQLEGKVEEVEKQMEDIQNRLKELQKYSKQFEGNNKKTHQHSSEFPDDLLPELANLVATSGSAGVQSIANEFFSEHGQVCTKKLVCAKVEDIAKKERRKEDGDLRAVWHVLPEYMNLLSVETLRHLRKEKDSRMEKKRSGSKHKKGEKDIENDNAETLNGATGPDGDFVEFPHYDGAEEPRENKKAFTLFCNGTRKEVKRSLDAVNRKDRDQVNKILKQKWFNLSDEEIEVWKKWQEWDRLRFKRDGAIYNKVKREKHASTVSHQMTKDPTDIKAVPKKRSISGSSEVTVDESVGKTSKSSFHIPKKKRQID